MEMAEKEHEHRRWLLLLGALALAWLIVESALAWNFFDG